MALILIIETATPYCSVALADNGEIIASTNSKSHNDHAAVLATYIKDIFQQSDSSLKDIQAVAVSKGPGSYTGLRIGVSAAKGLCFSLDIPLIGLNTLAGMAYGMIYHVVRDRNLDESTLFCPMIDARRMEVYSSVYDNAFREIKETCAEIIDENSFNDLIERNFLVFFGDGAQKTEPLFGKHPNVKIISSFHPSAGHFGKLAENAYRDGLFENVRYFEPYYLKQFIAGKPKVKGLQ
ncbi:MAG: tRNA (adenosine(37)-N6)-threonylcarbamoyltransferase complex dimerization subunit type 1 TsaB [Bacteroidales bacterium]